MIGAEFKRKALITEARRSVQRNRSAFLSLCVIILLGLAGFFAAQYAEKSMKTAGTEFFETNRFKDFDLYSSLGVEEEDVAQIRSVPGVTAAEGRFSSDAVYSFASTEQAVTALSLTEQVSTPMLTEGRLPTEAWECLVDPDLLEDSGAAIGDEIRLRITGPGLSETMDEAYSEMQEEIDEAEKTVSDADAQLADAMTQFSEAESLIKDGEEEIADAEKRLAVAEAAILDANERLEEAGGEEAIEAAAQELAEAEKALKIFADSLDSGLLALLDGEEKIRAVIGLSEEYGIPLVDDSASFEKQVDQLQSKLERAEQLSNRIKRDGLPIPPGPERDAIEQEIEKFAPGKTPEELLDELDDIIPVLQAALDEYERGRIDYYYMGEQYLDAVTLYERYSRRLSDAIEKLNELKEAEQMLEDGKAELEAAKKELEEKRAELEDNRLVLEEKQQELEEAKQELADAKRDLDFLKISVGELHSGTYTVTGTAYHPDWLRRDSTYTVVVLPEAFGSGEESPRYHSVSVLTDAGSEEDLFTDTYFTAVEGVKEALEQTTETLREDWRSRFQERFPDEEMPEELQENWIVLDRRSNAGYTEYRSTIGAVSGAGLSFGLLFLFVTGMECFSTVSLLVEEQKKLVGTEKAFGFRHAEIRFRYTRFGVLAALIGAVLGFALACGMGKLLLILLDQTGLYVFSANKLYLRPGLTLAVCVSVMVFCALVAVLACGELLRSSADDLMKGASSGSSRFLKPARSRPKNLYSSLILRNMLQEKGRVIMTVIVTAVSCMLIGAGITVKLAYDGMNIRQLRDVCLYDIRVDLGAGTEESVRRQLETEMNTLGVSWVPACYESCLFENGDRLDGTLLLCAEAERLGEIIGLTDPVSEMPLVPDDEGVLIQLRMAENLDLSPGDSLTVLDTRFKRVTTPVSGAFQNYQQRMIALTPARYAALFGVESAPNSYFISFNGIDDQTFRDALTAISPELSFERADSFFEQYRAIAFMYNAVVLGVTVIAILISFVILINLAAIFISRKKRELIIMRINGFSLRKTRAYLIREIAATTVIGMVLGVLCGIPGANLVVRFMETPDIMFVRDVQPVAWLIAVALEASFACIIYGRALREVKYWSVEDLAGTL